jgi:hypothetical protein
MPTDQKKLTRLCGRTSQTAWSTLQQLRDHPGFDQLLAHLEKVDGTLHVTDIGRALRHIAGGEGEKYDQSNDFVHSISPQVVQELQACLDAAIASQGADLGNIQLLDATGALRIVVHNGFQKDFLDYFASVRLDGCSVCARAFRAGSPLVVLDVYHDPAFEPHLAIAKSAGFRGVQSIPISDAGGTVIGMLSVHFRSPLQTIDWRIEALRLSAARAAAVLSPRE